MADSSEKVSFRVDMQCSSLRAEAFLVFDKGSQPTLGQQITDMRPTVGRLLAEDFRKIGKRQSADSFLGELFFLFSQITVIILDILHHCLRRTLNFHFSKDLCQTLVSVRRLPFHIQLHLLQLQPVKSVHHKARSKEMHKTYKIENWQRR